MSTLQEKILIALNESAIEAIKGKLITAIDGLSMHYAFTGESVDKATGDTMYEFTSDNMPNITITVGSIGEPEVG